MSGIYKLSKTLNEIWDRVNHIFPQTAKRVLLNWLIHRDRLVVTEDEATSETPPYPAYWAEDGAESFDNETNIYWGRGVWS